MGGSVKDVESKEELDNVVRQGAPVILHFWASWCEASKHMDQVFSHLSTDFPQAVFFRVCSLFHSLSLSMFSLYFLFKKFLGLFCSTLGEHWNHIRIR